MAQSIDFAVTRLDKNYIRIAWDNTLSDTDWVYVNGQKVSSTPVVGDTSSYVKVKQGNTRTAEIQVTNSDIEAVAHGVIPNYLPVITWKSGTSAYRYYIYIDNVLVRTSVAVSSRYLNKWQTTQHLSDGWHYLRVVAADKAGNTENSLVKWFRVWTPGAPVTTLSVSDGSGPGLYDIDLGV